MHYEQPIEKIINEAKDELVKLYNPVAIYIFGSYAWGHPDDYSDLDFLIIVEKIGNRYNDLVEGHRALGALSVPKDLLLLTRDEFEEASQRVTSLHYRIKREGKQIYARA